MNPRNIFFIVGTFLIAALFIASSWEAWEEKQSTTPPILQSNQEQMQENMQNTEDLTSQDPCIPTPMWAERCLIINGHGLFIAMDDIADTDAKRGQGLSGRQRMADNQAMLFVFEEPAQYSFWMHGMLFPLDFLWIRGGKIMEITENVPPPALGKTPQTITSSIPVDMVLEINAGWAEAHDVSDGIDIAGLQ